MSGDANIISLHQAFFEFWCNHRCELGRVSEKNVSLRALKTVLPNIIKLKKTSDGPRYSVLGSNVLEEYDQNFTGILVSDQPHEICKKADLALIKRIEKKPSFTVSFGFFCYPNKNYLRVMDSGFAFTADDGSISGYLVVFTVDRDNYLEKLYSPINPHRIESGKADVANQNDFDQAVEQYKNLTL